MIITTTISITLNISEDDTARIEKMNKIISNISEDNLCTNLSNKYIKLIKDQLPKDDIDTITVNAVTTIFNNSK